MTVIPITCDNCGAKYKLPPTFKGSQAKCQKCGSVIDVAKQREAAGADAGPAAAAKPAAAARPAVDRSKGRAAGGARKATAAKAAADKPARAGRGRAASDDDDGDERPRRGRAEKKKDNTPMILGGVGLLAILVVAGVFLLGGDGKEGDGKQGDAQAQADANAGDGDAAKGDTAQGDTPAAKPADQPTEGDAKPAGGDAKPSEGDPAAKPAEGDAKPTGGDAKPADAPKGDPVPMPEGPAGTPKEPWQKQRNPAQTMADVKSAAELYGEVEWPDSITADKKAEIQGIAEDLDSGGGIRHIRAKRKLVEEGYPALFAILERLHGLDYRQTEDAAFGFELNKMIEEITGGLNARYAAVQAGEEIHPAKAQWNTKTVKAWMATFAKWPDEDAFKESKRTRASKDG
ncbi:MAG: hypothetical protein KAI24_21060 [Planctomycetes bacterium]|nr:hypothetical protein [Planctomycetota bacterium]